MTNRTLIAVFTLALVTPLPMTVGASIATAQEQAPPAPGTPPAPPTEPARQPAPARPAFTANVQLDVAITDTVSGKPETKTLTLVVRPGASGSVRMSGGVIGLTGIPARLFLDARVLSVQAAADLIDMALSFEYQTTWPTDRATTEGAASPPAEVRQQIQTYLRPGRKVLVSRSLDPVTNRAVTVEVTATIREP